VNRGDIAALEQASRLEAIGVVVRSAELHAAAQQLQTFAAGGGNRAMRRAAARELRQKGRR
jgi:hypothetical protein